MTTLFLVVLPVECQRIESESMKYQGFPIRKSIALGGFAANVYQGVSGAALNFLKLYARTRNSTHLNIAKEYIDAALPKLPDLENIHYAHSFMWGPAGVLAVQAVIHSHLGDAPTATAALGKIASIIVANNMTQNDFLPGRAGLLFAARFVAANNPLGLSLPWSDTDLMAVAQSIISAGVSPGRPYMHRVFP